MDRNRLITGAMLRLRDEYRSGAWISGDSRSVYVSTWDLCLDGMLDAPDIMPAGACNSTEWRNGSGSPIAAQSEAHR